MKKMLFVTKLIVDATKEEMYIYMSLDDFRKYAFVKKNNLFIPYEDKKLLDDLNNKEKVVYYQPIEEEIDEKKSEHIKRTKKKRTAKERVQKALAGIGIAVTIFVSEPVIADGLSYSLKRINSFSHCTMIDEKTSNAEFMEQFAIAINKNQDYKEEERQVIIEGYKVYIDDWGYLLDEVDKEYILHMAETVNIVRGTKLQSPQYAGQYMGFGKIKLAPVSDISVLSHESAHAFSDRGLLVGSINGYGLGYALNEGINTSINAAYISWDSAYPEERKDTFKLSLLAEDEDLILAYQKKGPEYFCRKVAERNPNINYVDVLRYLSMMDIQFHFDTYEKIENYKLPISFFEEKEELYNKMFKAKYGYDYSESVLFDLEEKKVIVFNFLYSEIYYSRGDDFAEYEYSIPKELLAVKSSGFDYSQYIVGKTDRFKYPESAAFLASRNEIASYNSWNEFFEAFASKDSETPYEVDRVKSIFTQKLGQENFDYYMDCALDRIIKMNASPEFTACYIKELYDTILFNIEDEFKNSFETRFAFKVNTALNANNMEEALNLYTNSDIRFKKFDIYDLSQSVLPTEYSMLSRTDNYVVLKDGRIIVKVNEDEYVWNAEYGPVSEAEMPWDTRLLDGQEGIHFYVMRDSEIEKIAEFFDTSSGRYYFAELRYDLTPEQIATLDKDKITIYVASVVKTEDFNKQR